MGAGAQRLGFQKRRRPRRGFPKCSERGGWCRACACVRGRGVARANAQDVDEEDAKDVDAEKVERRSGSAGWNAATAMVALSAVLKWWKQR